MFLAPRNGIWCFRKGEILGQQAGNRNIVPKRCISHLFPTCFRRISLSWTPLKFPVSRYFKFPACFLVVSHCFPSPETTQQQPRNLKFPHKFPHCFPTLETPALPVVHDGDRPRHCIPHESKWIFSARLPPVVSPVKPNVGDCLCLP